MVEFNIRTKGKKVAFINIETQEENKFVSIREAALKMNISRRQINKNILSKELWGKYKILLIEKGKYEE